MDKISLRPMSPVEYEAWLPKSKAGYALEKEKSGLSHADAEAEAERSFRSLLPEGVATKGQHLFSVVETETQRPVGVLWWGLQKQGTELTPWIYDIILDESVRGRGYGRAAMLAAEQSVKAEGYKTLGLHVFGHNTVARGLYDSLGYETTNVVMRKLL